MGLAASNGRWQPKGFQGQTPICSDTLQRRHGTGLMPPCHSAAHEHYTDLKAHFAHICCKLSATRMPSVCTYIARKFLFWWTAHYNVLQIITQGLLFQYIVDFKVIWSKHYFRGFLWKYCSSTFGFALAKLSTVKKKNSSCVNANGMYLFRGIRQVFFPLISPVVPKLITFLETL